MKIKKFRLKSKRSEEDTFMVKKINKKVIFTEEHIVSDDCGNRISVRDKNGYKVIISSKESEGIIAYSLPSKTPAIVEILETEESIEGDVESSKKMMDQSCSSVKDDSNGRKIVDAAYALNNDIDRKPIVLPKSDRISWAD